MRRPFPTHYDPRRGEQMFGEPWISMSRALGWGASERPVPTVTAGGTSHGGYEPFGMGARDSLTREQAEGRWVMRRQVGASLADRLRDHPLDEPAPTITGGVSAPGSGNGTGLSWVLVSGNQPNAAERPAPAPAPTIAFGHNASNIRWALRRERGADLLDRGGERREHPAGEPAPAITAGNKGSGPYLSWVAERPATTVPGESRIGRPGHKGRESGGESHFARDSVRITVQEAAILQSFAPDYPWRGSRTKQYEQCGNAFPPLAAIAVLGEAVGLDWVPVAGHYRAEVMGVGE